MTHITELWADWQRNEDYLNSLNDVPEYRLSLSSELERRIAKARITTREDAIVKLSLLSDLLDGHEKEMRLLKDALSYLKTETPVTPVAKHAVTGIMSNTHIKNEVQHV